MPVKFEPPFKIIEHEEAFEVRDARGLRLSFTYFDDGADTVRRSVRQRMTKEEALAYVMWVCWAAEKSKEWKGGGQSSTGT